MKTGYTVEIKETNATLTAKQRIDIKDTTNAVRLDAATAETAEGEGLIIYPATWAVLGVHNEKSDDKEYETYVIVDKGGVKYTTGSEAFWNSFMGIYTEMQDETEEWGIKVYRMESKNYKGKSFITCSIV